LDRFLSAPPNGASLEGILDRPVGVSSTTAGSILKRLNQAADQDNLYAGLSQAPHGLTDHGRSRPGDPGPRSLAWPKRPLRAIARDRMRWPGGWVPGQGWDPKPHARLPPSGSCWRLSEARNLNRGSVRQQKVRRPLSQPAAVACEPIWRDPSLCIEELQWNGSQPSHRSIVVRLSTSCRSSRSASWIRCASRSRTARVCVLRAAERAALPPVPARVPCANRVLNNLKVGATFGHSGERCPRLSSSCQST